MERNDTSEEGSAGLASVPGQRGRPRALAWKDEYLIFSTFWHAGWSMKQIESIFHVSDTLVSDIVRVFATYLDLAPF
jgi:hypothetical protein